MVDARRLAYLGALGVDVYVPRKGGAELPAEPAVEIATEVLEAAAPAPARPRPVAKPPAPPVAPAAPVTPAVAVPSAGAGTLGWDQLEAAVATCTRCELHARRRTTVFGNGDRRASWMFIGEAPGVEEDREGVPFIGRAGQLLDRMIGAIGLRRDEVYVANVVKCHPPTNRDPKPAEAVACREFLERQIELVEPRLLVAVGRVAAQTLMQTDTAIGRLRGQVHAYGARGWPLVVVYHPGYLLRSPREKRRAWQDLVFAREVHARLEREAAVRAGAP